MSLNSDNERENQVLREERLLRGWSQQDVAEHVGTTKNNVSRWELGKTIPRPYFQQKLCELFARSAQDLGLVITREEERLHGEKAEVFECMFLDDFVRTLVLPPLLDDEGLYFLLRRAELIPAGCTFCNLPAELVRLARDIVNEMEGLPLALELAGAYIKRTKCTLESYIDLCRRVHYMGEYPVTASYLSLLTRVIAISIRKIAEIDASIADLLRLCAFLSPDPIPEVFFTKEIALLEPHLRSVVGDPYRWNRALDEASSFSLLQRDVRNRTISLHRAVQFVLKETVGKTVFDASPGVRLS